MVISSSTRFNFNWSTFIENWLCFRFYYFPLTSLVKKPRHWELKELSPSYSPQIKGAEWEFEPRDSDPRAHSMEGTQHGNRFLRVLQVLIIYTSMKLKLLFYPHLTLAEACCCSLEGTQLRSLPSRMLSLPVALSALVLGQSLPRCSEKHEHCPVLALTRSHCIHSCLFTCLSLTCVLLVFGPSTWPGQDKALQQCLGEWVFGKERMVHNLPKLQNWKGTCDQTRRVVPEERNTVLPF